MRLTIMAACTAVALSFGASSASAAPIMAHGAVPSDLQQSDALRQDVQYRRYYGGRRAYGPRYGYGGPRYYRRDRGSAAAGVIGGLAAGAIIGGAIANSQAQAVPIAPADDAMAYCAQRFRSYDPASGTYLAYDGTRRSCP